MHENSNRKSRRFVPGRSDSSEMNQYLEPRVVMTGSLTSIGPGIADNDIYESLLNGQSALGRRFAPNLIGSYSRGIQLKDSVNSRVSDAIDRSFDSFTSDYLDAQSAYLADSNTVSKNAFIATTRQRVSLLQQELTQILARVPGSLTRNKGASANSMQQFLTRQISGDRRQSRSLMSVLINENTTVPPVGANGPSVTLYTLTATNAIEAARVATVNATKFSASGIFRQK
jgi:hypothetical protein